MSAPLPAMTPLPPQPTTRRSPLPEVFIPPALFTGRSVHVRQLILAAGAWPTGSQGFTIERADSVVVIAWSMTAFDTTAGNIVTGTLTVDSVFTSTTKMLLNQANTHTTFPTAFAVFGTNNQDVFDVSLVDGLTLGAPLSAARHSWVLSISGTGASSDGNDRVWAIVLELPQS